MVTHSYPRWEGDVAGAFIERLNLGLTGLGHRLDVVVPADRGTRGSYNHNGILVHRAAYGSRGNETLAYTGRMSEALKSPFGIFRFLNLVGGIQREVRRLWGSGEFDLVHAHWWVPGGLAVVRSGGRPYVLTLHGTDVALLEKIPMVRALAAGVIRNAAARTTVSSYLARRAAVFSRLDVSDFEVQPMPPRIELAAEPARGDAIVTVGRLTKQKRVDVIVRALSVMKREGHEHSLLVVGDGPERSNLERLAQAL
ncbi:MAG: glycosyltransferase, partial [Gemmatimonadales bacterium]